MDTPEVPPLAPAEKLNSLLEELGMPEGHKPVTKKIASSRYKHDKQYTTPGEIATQLRAYEQTIATDASQVRNYITNKLIEISGCGDIKNELKALELLGKISGVGLFSERSEVTVTHTASTDLEAAIKDRIKRLLNADVIDIVPEEDGEEAEEVEADTQNEATPEEPEGEE